MRCCRAWGPLSSLMALAMPHCPFDDFAGVVQRLRGAVLRWQTNRFREPWQTCDLLSHGAWVPLKVCRHLAVVPELQFDWNNWLLQPTQQSIEAPDQLILVHSILLIKTPPANHASLAIWRRRNILPSPALVGFVCQARSRGDRQPRPCPAIYGLMHAREPRAGKYCPPPQRTSR